MYRFCSIPLVNRISRIVFSVSHLAKFSFAFSINYNWTAGPREHMGTVEMKFVPLTCGRYVHRYIINPRDQLTTFPPLDLKMLRQAWSVISFC